MGFTDTIRKITNWETAFSIAFTFGAIVTAAIIFAYLDHIELSYACIVALGIPTSFFGSVVNKAKVNGSTPVSGNEQLNRMEIAQAEQSVLIADLKSEVEYMKIDKEVKEL